MTERADREHILIAVPSLDHKVSAGIADLFAAAQQRNFIEGFPYKFTTSILRGVRGYALARNNIAKMFLDGPFDRLWMIDDDIVPNPGIFDLLSTDGDIVAPLMPIYSLDWNSNEGRLVFRFDHAVFEYADINDLDSRIVREFKPGMGVLDVAGVGFGCTLIRRRVLSDGGMVGSRKFTRMNGTECELDADCPPPIFNFRTLPNGACEASEDWEFCWRAKRLGYSVKLDTRIEVGHLKSIDIGSLFMIMRHLQE